MDNRGTFGSRFTATMAMAGSAIGLGNIWRFPYIAGKYGGGAFIIVYLLSAVFICVPIFLSESIIGKSTRLGTFGAMRTLAPGSRWKWLGLITVITPLIILSYYSVVGGWSVEYLFKAVAQAFGTGAAGAAAASVAGAAGAAERAEFASFISSTWKPIIAHSIFLLANALVVLGGVKKGIEKFTKITTPVLFVLIVVIMFYAISLPGAQAGINYLVDADFSKLTAEGVLSAMGQAFFTLTVGIGSIAIFGSYIGKERRLTGEAISVTVLDTFVALMAGFIIFPACFAYGVEAGSGPSLIFITLPNVFNAMAGGRIWGFCFFLFMSFAAISTVVAVFENIMSFSMDMTGCSRKKAAICNGIAIVILSMPCILGFNILSGFEPLGAGSNILDLEDFIVSNNILPLGSLVYLLFCTTKYGWGFEKFSEEANTGEGIRLPKAVRGYMTWILPLIVLLIFVQGYVSKFF